MKSISAGIVVGARDTVRLDAKGKVEVGGSYGVYDPEGTENSRSSPRAVIHSKRKCTTVWHFVTYRSWV